MLYLTRGERNSRWGLGSGFCLGWIEAEGIRVSLYKQLRPERKGSEGEIGVGEQASGSTATSVTRSSEDGGRWEHGVTVARGTLKPGDRGAWVEMGVGREWEVGWSK